MADKEKYFQFLKEIPKVPSLKMWDPVNFAPKLCIDGVITADELETIENLKGTERRKIVREDT